MGMIALPALWGLLVGRGYSQGLGSCLGLGFRGLGFSLQGLGFYSSLFMALTPGQKEIDTNTCGQA